MKLNYFSRPFDATLRGLRITAKSLSEVTGISQSHISDFRNGKNISVEALSLLLKEMEVSKPGSVGYFVQELARELNGVQVAQSVSVANGLEAMIEAATDEEIEQIMLAIARKWRLRNRQDLCA